jgi:hypothetical protein
VAFVLPAGAPDDVRMIDLGEAEAIDRMVADFRAGLLGAGESAPAGLALREAVFTRLGAALGGRKRLLLAPDGDLARLPWEVLPTADGRRLIDDYQVSYLGRGRDVLRFGAASNGPPGAPLVLADPDFDLDLDLELELDLEPELGNEDGPQPPGGAGASAPGPTRPRAGFWSRLLGRNKVATPAGEGASVPPPATPARLPERRSRDFDPDARRFDRLPGTRAAGESIAGLLGVRPWLGAAALEGRLRSGCRSPRILHLATHAFFLPDRRPDPGRDARLDPAGGVVRRAGPPPENPLLRSGLALAGANHGPRAGRPPGPRRAEDGLLTAEDVSGLDLLATELVVLPACEAEAGRAQAQVGEGVSGLRQAFVLAGARTLVLSLWKVPDEPARVLLDDFYRRVLAGQGRADALRAAQLATRARYPDPSHWGAFVCQGDPAPLGRTPAPARPA